MNADNLQSRLSRVYLDPRSFVADDGRTVKYTPLVLEWHLGDGRTYDQVIKITPETKAIIELALPAKEQY
jgi:hypothetical protein